MSENRNVVDLYKEDKNFMRNDLILSLNKMDYITMKLFEFVLSKVDPENPPATRIVDIKKIDFYNLIGGTIYNRKQELEAYIEKMQVDGLFKVYTKIDNDTQIESIMPITYAKWTYQNTIISFKFSEDIMPYIAEFTENFTSYDMKDIQALETKYGIIMYRIFKLYHNQFVNYKKKGTKRKEQLYAYQNPTISISDLRFYTNNEKTYTRINSFLKRVIDSAVEDINENTNFQVSYTKNKKGKMVDSLTFNILTKKVAPASPEDNPDFEEKNKLKNLKDAEIYTYAMGHKYTRKLLETKLLTTENIIDQSKMIKLAVEVFPYYEEIEKLKGEEKLSQHLRHVKNKKAPLSQQEIANGKAEGIVEYLRIAASRYVPTIRIQNAKRNNLQLQKDTIFELLDKSLENQAITPRLYEAAKQDVEDIAGNDEDDQAKIDAIEALMNSLNLKKIDEVEDDGADI